MPVSRGAPGPSGADPADWQVRPGALVGFYAILLALALFPIFAFDVAPLGDWPNHLARAYILNHLASDVALQKYYAVEWHLFSFQSTDFILPLLTRLLGLTLGAQVYIAATFGMLVGGTAAVHRALFGRVGLWPSAAVLFLYCFPFSLGQISFLFATGFGLLLFAAWIATPRRPGIVRTVAFSIGTLTLFFCHFFALASFALTIATYELARSWRRRDIRQGILRLAQAGVPFILPVVFFLIAFHESVHGLTAYGDILSKAIAVLTPTLTHGGWPDIVLTTAVCLALWPLSRRKRLSFASAMRLTAFVLIAAAVAMPRLLTGVIEADVRIPSLLSFLLVAASDIRLRQRRESVAFATGISALLLFRVVTSAYQWQVFDADYREFRAADAILPRSSRVVEIPFQQDFRAHPQPLLPYWFVASFAVIDRDVFLPHLYTVATPLRFTPAGAALFSDELAQSRQVRWRPRDPAFAAADSQTARQVEAVGQRLSTRDIVTSTIDWSDWPEQFDYAVDLNFARFENPVPALLTEVWRGSYFSIYRIHPPDRN